MQADYFKETKVGDMALAAMFEHTQDMTLPTGTISPYPGNLAVCNLETRNVTYAAVIQNSNVHVAHWDNKTETPNWDSFYLLEPNTNHPITITQVGLVHPNARSLPLVIVATVLGVQVYDIRSQRLLMQVNLDTILKGADVFKNEIGPFCRGISCNDNTILVGTHQGEILILMCNGESSITTKRSLKEHQHAIADIATCRFDEITCSATTQGEVIVWQKPVKGVQSRIQTKQLISCLNVLRKQVIIGTLRGLVQFYAILTGELMCEVNAHARIVTSISVAPESAYVLSASEDGYFNVYKLHTRKPHAYQVEYRHSHNQKYGAIVGAQFTNGRGSAIATGCYDKTGISFFKIVKKLVPGTE